jgi:hypothetical protein
MDGSRCTEKVSRPWQAFPILHDHRHNLLPLQSHTILAVMASSSRLLRGLSLRTFSTSSIVAEEVAATTTTTTLAASTAATAPPPPIIPDRTSVHTPKGERRLLRTHRLTPIGSRRRRAAMQSGSRIPFEQLPYQCFQEARKILIQHRQEKIQDIEAERQKIARLKAVQVDPQNEQRHQHRINSMERYLHQLKIHADINDPMVKRRFEDDKGMIFEPTISTSLTPTPPPILTQTLQATWTSPSTATWPTRNGARWIA